MRALILTLTCLSTACALDLPGGVSTDRDDHRLHAVAGAVTVALVNPVSCYLTRDMEPGYKRYAARVLIDSAAAGLVGVAKEMYDNQGYGTCDKSDAFATLYGGLGASLVINVRF